MPGLPYFLYVGIERLGRVQLLKCQFRMAKNYPQHVVEVVGHTAGQPTHRFHLLGLQQLALQYLLFLFSLLALANVLDDRDKIGGIAGSVTDH